MHKKVYCDRLATVNVSQVGEFECPKCKGVCRPYVGPNSMKPAGCYWDCSRCGRGWEQVPDACKDAREAESYLLNRHA